MKGTQQDLNPSTQSDYRRAFEKVKSSNKKLTKQLAKLQNQIKERCQSYMMEICRLKQGRPQLKIGPKRQLGLYNRIVDFKSGAISVPESFKQSITSPSNTSSSYQDTMNFSTAKATRIQSSDLDKTTQTKRVQGNSEIYSMQTSKFNIQQKGIQIQRLKEQLDSLRKQHQKEFELRKSQRISGSVSDSAAPEQETRALENIKKQFEEQMRIAQEKIYVYEAIFVNIFNLLMKDRRDTMRTVQQIRTIKYNQLQTKLQALFGLIRINQDTIQLIQREKKELLLQIEYLSSRVQDLTKRNPIKYDVGVETTQIEQMKDSFKLSQHHWIDNFQLILPQCKTVNLPKFDCDNRLLNIKQEKIQKIKNLYEQRISEKYKEIASLKSSMKNLIEQLQKSVYSTQGFTKTLRVNKQLIQYDEKPDLNDSFTKRKYIRKKVITKSVSQSSLNSPSNIKPLISELEDQNSLAMDILKINKQLASRISEVSQQGRESISQSAFTKSFSSAKGISITSKNACLSKSFFK